MLGPAVLVRQERALAALPEAHACIPAATSGAQSWLELQTPSLTSLGTCHMWHAMDTFQVTQV